MNENCVILKKHLGTIAENGMILKNTWGYGQFFDEK